MEISLSWDSSCRKHKELTSVFVDPMGPLATVSSRGSNELHRLQFWLFHRIPTLRLLLKNYAAEIYGLTENVPKGTDSMLKGELS
jgi:hypothetical protein